ncbi:unnamed protein product, partial [marine sediment metagenome]
MSNKVNIVDGISDIIVKVDNASGKEDSSLVVATRPLKTYASKTAFFTNTTYGREMAQNGLYGGVQLLIHDGDDNAAWDFSEPVGTKWVEDDTGQYHADAQALLCDNANVGDILQLLEDTGP